MEKEKKAWVWLDARHLGKTRLESRFPTIYKRCLEAGYQADQDLISVCPAHHYHMGGLAVDLEGRTSLPGLYSIGEAACNRVHGANRLASNSLLESLVFAKAAARAIPHNLLPPTHSSFPLKAPTCSSVKHPQGLIFEAIERSRVCDPSTPR